MTSTDEVIYETAPAAKPAALWEDFIDIFYAPSSVFERRKDASPWPPILVVSALFILISVATFGALSPAIENEMRHQMAANPNMTADQVNTAVGMTMKFARFGALVAPILMAVIGLWYWLVGYPFAAQKRTVSSAILVVSYAYVIKCIGALVGGIQALLMDPAKLTSPFDVSLTAVRFVDRASVSPILYAMLNQIDIIDFWYIALLAIGLRVIGKASRNSAILFGVTYWLLGVAWAVIGALRAAAAAG